MTNHSSGQDDGTPAGTRSPEEIAELFDLVGRETEAIRQLTGCVEQLHEVQAAKKALAGLSPGEVRAALAYRRLAAGES